MNNILFAFLITLLAGFSTTLGSIFVISTKKLSKKFLCISLGFSAGVMIYLSMIEIFKEAENSLSLALGPKLGPLITVLSFFSGMAIIAIIDKLVPNIENPHELKDENDVIEKNILLKTGIFTAVVMAIHNFPEGLATFISAMNSLEFAIPVAIAIAIHNIPEGISVSIPILYGTGSKKKAFFYSFISGMSEPLGALVGFFFLGSIFNDLTISILLAATAGIMVFISLDELLPTAGKYCQYHFAIYGLIAGMFFMAISLLII